MLAGGRSSEHEVSLSSGAAVREGLLAAATRSSGWRSAATAPGVARASALSVTPGAGLLGADVVFPALHGPFGEDGTVQGLLETLDVAYVGAGVAASAVCMDKVLFKELMSARACPRSTTWACAEDASGGSASEVLAEIAALGLPVFVKPAHLGSSVGIVKVTAPSAMREALEEAFAHDELVIVEAMAHGVEVECGVLGTLRSERAAGGRRRPWHPSRARSSSRASGMTTARSTRRGHGAEGARAHLLRRDASACRSSRWRRSSHAGCDGLARVDFFVDGERVLRQRAEHDARLHSHERLRQADGGLRRPLPGARRPSLPAGAGAPRPSWRATATRPIEPIYLNSVSSAIDADSCWGAAS